MRAIVTGGAGFIGSRLSQRLKEDGHDVLVIDSLASGPERLPRLRSLGIDVEMLDIRQEKLVKIVSAFGPEVIFHLAAQADVRKSVADAILDAKVNVVGLIRVLDSARSSGARVVFAQSGGTIYGEAPPPVPETYTGNPTSPYGITKRVAEDYLRFYRDAFGVQFVSLALANVYGPGQDPRGEAGVVAIFASRLVAGQECVIYGDGKQTRDFVFVDDVVSGFMAGAEKGDGKTINIGTGTETAIVELYDLMAKVLGSDKPPRFEPERPGELKRNALDVSKAASVLGWRPSVGLSEGLQTTIDSFR